MERLWRWEENNDTQNKKRKALWIVAVLCWLAALAGIYWVEHTLYGNIVDAHTGLFIGIAIGNAIGTWMRETSGRAKKPVTQRQKWAGHIISVIGLGVLAYFAVFFGEVMILMQTVCTVTALYWQEHKEKQDVDKISVRACTLLFASVMLVIGTLAGVKAMGLTSTCRAERTVTEQGFADAEYLGRLQGRWVYEDAVDQSFYQEEMERKWFYMLFGRRDEEPWRFIIDPKGGGIIFAASEQEEPELGNWYRSRESGE